MRLKSLLNKKNFFILLYVLFLAVSFKLCIDLYVNYINMEVSKRDNKQKVYYASNFETNSRGFNVLKPYIDLGSYSNLSDNVYTYKVKGENFYFNVTINKDDTLSVNKLIDSTRHINARLNIENITEIDYISGNPNKSTVLKIITKNGDKYLAITDSTYYMIGNDIDEIILDNGQFYYISYNPKYYPLRLAEKCNDSIRKQIDGFDSKNYYYRIGEINFLRDYYQKINSKYYYVKDYCNYLKKQ